MTDLTTHDIAGALLDIANGRKTGVLRLGEGGRLRMAFFEDGALVYVVSEVAEESVAAHLTKAGRLETPEARAAVAELEKKVSRKRSLVSLVLEAKLVDEETLRAWLVEYAYDVFAGIFASHGLGSKLTEGMRAPHPLPYRVPVAQLVLEAAGRIRNPEIVREAIGPLSYYTEPGTDYARRIATLPLSFHDGRIAALVEGPIAIADLVAISGFPEIDALRSILALRLVGAIAPFYEMRVTDTGKLRRRKAALESGYAVDADTAAAALGFALASDGSGGAISMGELDGSTPVKQRPDPPPPAPQTPPVQQQRQRGDTTRLKLLSSAYIQMAEAEAAAGNYAAAIECFDSALSQKPEDLAVLLAYAKMHANRPGGFSQAEKLLERAAEAHPRSVSPVVALARLYHQTGRAEEAEDALHEARRIEPNSAEVRVVFEEILKSRGGLLSKLKLRGDRQKPPSKITPPAPPTPQRPLPLRADSSGQRCRICGRALDHEMRACPSCGATL